MQKSAKPLTKSPKLAIIGYIVKKVARKRSIFTPSVREDASWAGRAFQIG